MELLNTFVLPNKTVNTLQEALDFRFLTAKNKLEFEGLSIWTVKSLNGKNKEIHLDSVSSVVDFKENDFFLDPNPIEEAKGHISQVQYFFAPVVKEEILIEEVIIVGEHGIEKGVIDATIL
jgi:hypothetical protein